MSGKAGCHTNTYDLERFNHPMTQRLLAAQKVGTGLTLGQCLPVIGWRSSDGSRTG